MLRRSWKPIIGTTVLVGAPGYLYYRNVYTKRNRTETFDLAVRVRGPDGKPAIASRTMSLLTKEQVETCLKEHEQSYSALRPEGILWKYHTSHFAANDPIEDAYASRIVERDSSSDSPAGDLLFFAVMDGHAGFSTSRLLSKTLLPAVALELSTLGKEPNHPPPKRSWLQSILPWIHSGETPPINFDADPKYVSLAIQTAFATLDSEIINAPLRILGEAMAHQGKDATTLPDLSQHPMALASMFPAMSGSCALMALFDTAYRNLYVACTGDCRAVAGVWEESEDGKGTWRADVLTEDQTGRNPNELKRMQSEHPPDEANTVIMRGRVLGGLEPTRAFGDARYKWSREIQEILTKVFLQGNNEQMRATPSLLKTPPYVTPRPVITHRKLSFDPSSPSTPAPSKSKLRFLVLATDGLWDQLTSEEVVSLVGGYLSGLKGTIPKSDLPTLIPTTSGTTIEGKDKPRLKDTTGSWAFVDNNISTHLIRNAFGGGDTEKLRKMLSIPAPLARNYRDDVTCTVVFWEEGHENEGQVATFSPEQLQQQVKSKL